MSRFWCRFIHKWGRWRVMENVSSEHAIWQCRICLRCHIAQTRAVPVTGGDDDQAE